MDKFLENAFKDYSWFMDLMLTFFTALTRRHCLCAAAPFCGTGDIGRDKRVGRDDDKNPRDSTNRILLSGTINNKLQNYKVKYDEKA